MFDERIRLISGTVRFNEPASAHSTIKAGGPVRVWLEPATADDLKKALAICAEEDIPWFVIGNGSNVLVREGGYSGAMLSCVRLFKDTTVLVEDEKRATLKVGSGVPLSHIVEWGKENGAMNIEFLAGIPGTLGGALVGNAGTKKGAIGEFVEEITLIDRRGHEIAIPKGKIEFSYRKTKLPRTGIVTSVVLSFEKGDPATAAAHVAEMMKKRTDTQPLEFPSLGSIFKNPESGKKSAGELIDNAGLRGVRVGGARIADQHANWIINEGTATASDIEVLIRLIRDKVRASEGVALEPEIIMIGKENAR